MLWPDAYLDQRPTVTPLALSLGAVMTRYGAARLGTLFLERRREPLRMSSAGLVLAGRVATAVLLVAGLFWMANGFAALYGKGRAEDDVRALPRRPEVVLDTTDPLDFPAGVTETQLPADAGDFRYRYRGLRLLVESGGRLFLVPAVWDQDLSRAVVVEYGESVRLQLIPQPPIRR